MEIKANAIELVDPTTLKFYSRNRNKHTPEQIERLAKLISHHGMRDPLTVSNLSGEVITGNGTLETCIKLGMKLIPIVRQDFKDEDEEYSFSVSHNAIQAWSELDLSHINQDLPDLGIGDIELLGIKDFNIDFEPIDDSKKEEEDAAERFKFIICPECNSKFEEKQAVIIRDGFQSVSEN